MNKCYQIDTKLPVSGHKCKDKNKGLVLLRLEERPWIVQSLIRQYLRLAIDKAGKRYHATVVYEEFGSATKRVDIEIPDEALDALVKVSEDPDFMHHTSKNEELFPDICIIDGDYISIDLISDLGRFKSADGILNITRECGAIETESKSFYTGIDLIFNAMDAIE